MNCGHKNAGTPWWW